MGPQGPDGPIGKLGTQGEKGAEPNKIKVVQISYSLFTFKVIEGNAV